MSEIYTKADVDKLREVLGDSPGARLLIELEVLRTEVESLRRDAERYRRMRHKMTCGSFTAAEELAVIGAKTADAFDAAVDAMNGANA
jgi:hypothetical protein